MTVKIVYSRFGNLTQFGDLKLLFAELNWFFYVIKYSRILKGVPFSNVLSVLYKQYLNQTTHYNIITNHYLLTLKRFRKLLKKKFLFTLYYQCCAVLPKLNIIIAYITVRCLYKFNIGLCPCYELMFINKFNHIENICNEWKHCDIVFSFYLLEVIYYKYIHKYTLHFGLYKI